MTTGVISSSNQPLAWAAAAFWWLPAANSSSSSRVKPYLSTRFSAVSPMAMSATGSWASLQPSSSWMLPMRNPCQR